MGVIHIYSQSVWVHHSSIEELGGDEKVGAGNLDREKKWNRKKYRTLRWEGRVQVQTTDLLKRLQPGRPPLDFSSASFMDSQLFPLYHRSLHLLAANYQGLLNTHRARLCLSSKGFWTGFILGTRKRGTCWLHILEGPRSFAEWYVILPTETEGVPNNCRPGKLGTRRKCINNHICYALLKIQKDFKFKW